ncbi:MAG: hypothetical protein K2H47_00915 [Muribaculaceae bacterium]|nr:hypothetical protein [Muribaculaceae bacterium]
MLTSYGKLDETEMESDFTIISKVIKSTLVEKDIKRAVQCCRDYALARVLNIQNLIQILKLALKLMCKAQEDRETRMIKKYRADQGMTERYRSLTKRLHRERIKKIGKELIYTDSHTDDPEITKLVRRIVEKRAAQTVHRNSGKRNRETNHFRQSVRRATSFSLYNTNFIEYDVQKRVSGTHWKVVFYNCKGKKMLKAKFSYNSFEEAVEACNRYILNHPGDPRSMNAYKCEYCGKWHIGHERLPEQALKILSEGKEENNTKIPA